MTIRANVLQLLENHSTDELVQNHMLFGIELEFSELGGLLVEGDSRPTEDDAEEMLCDEQWTDILIECWNRRSDVQRNIPDSSLRLIARTIVDNWSDGLEELVNYCTDASYQGLINDRLNTLLENWTEEESFADIYGWENSPDGTQGIKREFKTSHPVTLDIMKNRLRELFDEAGDEAHIPLNGSAHIHISFPNSRHAATQTSMLHCCILYELAVLLRQSVVLPVELYKRWRKHENYFRFSAPPGEKFSAVHCHPQGTWEFRLWGGMNDRMNIIECLEISGTALANGYRRFVAGDYAITDSQYFRNQFSDFMKKLITCELEESDTMPDVPDIGVKSELFHIACGSFPFDSSWEFNQFNAVSIIPHNCLG